MPQQPVIDRRQSLDAIPVLNGGIAAEPRRDGQLDLVIRTPRRPGLLARFMPPMLEKRFKLDALGTFVFAQIDGARTVAQIMEAFRGRFKLNRRETEISVAAFLRLLAERRIISIVVKDPPGSACP